MAHPLAGQRVPAEQIIDVQALERDYYERIPELDRPGQAVSFGTSGHRGTPLDGSFTEAHILAITQSICEFRAVNGTTGPVFMGRDTHAVSSVAQMTALEVLAANGVETFIQRNNGVTPTPVISHAILTYNHERKHGLADGIIITPSHNPPEDGGFKYNPPNGGPADTDITGWIQRRANELLKNGNAEVKHIPYERALKAETTHQHDYVPAYVDALAQVIDVDAIRDSGIKIGVDPLGGASLGYWEPLAEKYGLKLTVVNKQLDPTFSFMTLDHDGKIRMDCSSPYAMAGLVGLKDQYDIAFGADPDADRHGIVTPSVGLMNPNHYLAVAIGYLLSHRPAWSDQIAVGKTLVSSNQIDRVVGAAGRKLLETPVGFKWFAPGLFDGSVCFGGEESAGASFLQRDGKVWTTDKDGLILGLLAAEITAVTGKDPAVHYRDLEDRFGSTFYIRLDTPVTLTEKAALGKLVPEDVSDNTLAGDAITARLTKAPGNQASIGGLKVVTEGGWFAARPSGTEDIYKLYAESLKSEEHLQQIVKEATDLVARALAAKLHSNVS